MHASLLPSVRREVGGLPVDLVAYYPAYAECYKAQEPESVAWCMKVIKQDWTILDIGAHVGYYSMLFSHLAPKGKVHAFEPCPETATMLRANLTYNEVVHHRDLSNITVATIAVGNKPGIHQATIWPTGRAEYSGAMTFTTVDVQSLTTGPIHFIKSDTDGWDLEVLQGAVETIEIYRPLMLVEVNYALAWRHHEVRDVEDLLDTWRYEHRILDGENWACWPREQT